MARNYLPLVRAAVQPAQKTMLSFPGLKRCRGVAEDGAGDMKNLCTDAYPRLRTRKRRVGTDAVMQSAVLCARGVCDMGEYTYCVEGDGIKQWKGIVTPQTTKTVKYAASFNQVPRTMAALRDWLVIMPDCLAIKNDAKKGAVPLCYQIHIVLTQLQSGESGDQICFVEQSDSRSESLKLRVGDRICFYTCKTDADGMYYPGSAVGSITVRSLTAGEDNTYLLTTDCQSSAALSSLVEQGAFIVHDSVPYAKLTSCANRIWSCNENSMLSASCLGDPFNYDRYEGLISDAWKLDLGRSFRFTAAYTYQEHPIFFTEHSITKILGEDPSEYAVNTMECYGVARDSEHSVAQAGDALFWLSNRGVVRYDGTTATLISQPLGDWILRGGVAASDGRRYYLSCTTQGGKRLLVYDTLYGTWSAQDDVQLVGYSRNTEDGGVVLFTDKGNRLFLYDDDNRSGVEGAFPWYVLFDDLVERDSGICTIANTRYLHALQVRMNIPAGTSVQLSIGYNGGELTQIAGCAAGPTNQGNASFYIPLQPRRADRCALQIAGTGSCEILSVTRVYHIGSGVHTGGIVQQPQQT